MVSPLQNYCEAVQSALPKVQPISNQVFCYHNRLHVLPENFKWPKRTVLTAWQYWCLGSEEDGYPPLQKISSSVISTTGVKRQFSDFVFLNQKIKD
jgi:hypothetical protein